MGQMLSDVGSFARMSHQGRRQPLAIQQQDRWANKPVKEEKKEKDS
jgi:hypothetical protein